MATPLELWERLLKLPGGAKNPFTDPYGPTTECFSDNDVVRMLQLGAESRYVRHLSSCRDCESRVDAFVDVTDQQVLQPRGHRPRGWVPFWSREKPALDRYAHMWARALVYIPSECVVKLKNGEVESIRVELITKQIEQLREMNVWLRGPVTADATQLVFNDAGYPSVILHKVKASKEVLQGLKNHNRLTKQLEVRVGETIDSPRLTGSSNIDFRRFDPKTDLAGT
jgi:hypothetical protein